MRNLLFLILAMAFLVPDAYAVCNVPICREQGGARITVGSGGSVDILSSGELDIESGGALKIAGTSMTASAAELNIMDGVTSTTAELNIMDGVTATFTEINLIDGFTGTTADLNAVVASAGRGSFVVCGETTTINNNTVFYGPDITLLTTNLGLTCDINAVGNTTEATADAPILTNQAIQVLGMTCRNEADANADISFTLRTAAGATVPSVTCSIADGERDCVANVQTTTAIAAGATVAIAAASSGDIADANGFVCNIVVTY